MADQEPGGATVSWGIQGFFRSGGFVYDNGPEAPSGHGLFQIRQLLERRRGTTEQYASAFAVMARNLGYRSRVAAGYLPGRLVLPRTPLAGSSDRIRHQEPDAEHQQRRPGADAAPPPRPWS